MTVEPNQGLVEREAGGLQGLAIAVVPLGEREDVEPIDQDPDPAVAVGDEVIDRQARAAHVVEQDAVRLDPPRRAVEEDDRRAKAGFGLQEAVVMAHRHDHYSADATLDERRDDVPLALDVLVGAGGDEEMAAGSGDLLDGPGHRGEEGVRHVADDKADRRRAHAVAEAPGVVVPAEAQVADRLLDPVGGLGTDARLVVDDPRDGLEAHVGPRGDVAERGSGAGGRAGARRGSGARGRLCTAGPVAVAADHRRLPGHAPPSSHPTSVGPATVAALDNGVTHDLTAGRGSRRHARPRARFRCSRAPFRAL